MSTLILTGKLAGTAALVVGAALTGVHAVSADATTTASAAASSKASTCVSDDLKADLKDARKAARQAPDAKKQRTALKAARKAAHAEKGDQRREARAEIAKDLASGTYGEQLQQLAKVSAERRDACRDQRTEKHRAARADKLAAAAKKAAGKVPDGATCHRFAASSELKAARKAARAEPKGKERRAALAAVRKDVIAGKYGADAKAAATAAKEQHAKAAKVSADDRQKLKAARKAATAKPEAERKAALKALRHDVLGGTYGDALEQRATQHQQRHSACRAEQLQHRADKAAAAAKA